MPTYRFTVNGESRSVEVRDPAEPLLYVLRNALGLSGTKFGCGLGQCGACTVLLDGRAVRSCQLPVSKIAGRSVSTIEGLGSPEKPHPVQAAFIAEQAAQCGYCSNGMVMSSVALLAGNPKPSREQVKAALEGNLCRCGTHPRVLRAVARASGTGRASS
jgi:nicotinate dehydrogenase subunit A